MKIDPASNMSRTLPPQVNRKDGGPAGAEFKNILEQEMEPFPGQNIDQGNPPSGPEMIPEMGFRPIKIVDGKVLLQQVEGLLDRLEVYQQQLMDSGISLKEMSPLVDRIRAEGEHLSSILGKLDSRDGMRDILSQTLIATSLEVIRFNRGDYIG